MSMEIHSDFGPQGLGNALHWPRVRPMVCVHARTSLISHPFPFMHSSLISDSSVLRCSPFISLCLAFSDPPPSFKRDRTLHLA